MLAQKQNPVTMSHIMASTQVISTRDLMKKRLAENTKAAPAGSHKIRGTSRDHSSTAMDRARREK